MNLFLYSVLSCIVILITAVFPLAISFADGIGSKRGKGVCLSKCLSRWVLVRQSYLSDATTVGEKEKQLFSD